MAFGYLIRESNAVTFLCLHQIQLEIVYTQWKSYSVPSKLPRPDILQSETIFSNQTAYAQITKIHIHD